METSPWRTGSFVWAAAAAMGAERKASFIGENPPGDALLHGHDHAADGTAGEGLGLKGRPDDDGESRRYLIPIAENQNQGKQNVQDCHERHDDLGHTGNPLEPSDENKGHTESQKKRSDDDGPGVRTDSGNGDRPGRIRIKKAVDGRRNPIDLGKGSDAE